MVEKKEAVVKYHPKLAKWFTATENRTKLNVENFLVVPKYDIEYINTGSTVLNLLIGGTRLPDGKFVCPGWARGTINEIYGRESSGKSTIALTGVGQCTAAGGTAVYIDLECGVRANYAARLGCDFRPPNMGGNGRAVLLSPYNFEEVESIVTHAALQQIDLIVIDSVAALVSRREQKRDVSDEKQKQGMAEIPRLMSQWLPKLQQIIARTKTCVLFLNQTRDKIGAMGYTEEALKSTTGGNALKFYSSTRILLKPRKITKAKKYNPVLKDFEDVEIASDIEAKMIKNKIDASKGHSGLITLRYGVGIDELRCMLSVAIAYKIIKVGRGGKGGNQEIFIFKMANGTVVEDIGVEKFRQAMTRQAGALEEMTSLCTDRILDGFKMIDDDELASLAADAVVTDVDQDDYESGPAPEILEQTEPDEDDEGGGIIVPTIDSSTLE
jgi:recombination protein RecA